MSSRGYIKLYRSLFKHEFFRPGKFSEREAFTWMIAEAAWKPRNRRVGQFFVDLERGELVASLRHLAEVWMWEVGAVRGYLSRCEKVKMLSTRSDKGITIVTVCNYDTYQGDDGLDNTGDDKVSAQGQQGPSTPTTQGQHNTEEGKNLRKEEGEEGELDSGSSLFGTDLVPAPKATAPDFDGMFKQWYAVYPKKVDPKDAERCFIRVLKARQATFEQLLVGARRYAQEMVRTEKRHIKAPSVWLNKGSWLNEPGAYSGGTLATPSRADSAIEGMFSDLTEEDFHGRTR